MKRFLSFCLALADSSGYEGSPGWESFPLTGM